MKVKIVRDVRIDLGDRLRRFRAGDVEDLDLATATDGLLKGWAQDIPHEHPKEGDDVLPEKPKRQRSEPKGDEKPKREKRGKKSTSKKK